MICSGLSIAYLEGIDGGHDLRIPRAVGTTGVGAALAHLDVRGEELLALAAVSADPLPGLPVDEVLAAALGRSLENVLLVAEIPVGDDGRVLGAVLEDGGALLAALLPLGFGSLGGDAGALLAARVLALGALLSEAERGAANVALAVHAHLDRLLDTEDVALGLVPVIGLQLDAIELAKLLRPLIKDLASRDLGGLGSRSLLLGGGGDRRGGDIAGGRLA